MSHEAVFAKLSDCLRRAHDARSLEESRELVAEAIQRAERTPAMEAGIADHVWKVSKLLA